MVIPAPNTLLPPSPSPLSFPYPTNAANQDGRGWMGTCFLKQSDARKFYTPGEVLLRT